MPGMTSRCKAKLYAVLPLCVMVLFQVACGHSNKRGIQIPIGWVDTPSPGATLSGSIPMKGWAADETGITSVCLYVDRKQVSCTEDITIARPDVAAAWPTIPGSEKSGWQMQLDTSSLSPGQHQMLFQATSKSGTTRDIGLLSVTVNK